MPIDTAENMPRPLILTSSTQEIRSDASRQYQEFAVNRMISADIISQELRWVEKCIGDISQETNQDRWTLCQWVVAVAASLNRLQLISNELAHTLNDRAYEACHAQ